MKKLIGKVHKICFTGKHGPYAIVAIEQTNFDFGGSITFSLSKPTWNEGKWPEPGTDVVLEDLRHKSAGWRAHKSRYLQPEDLSL